MFSSASEKVTPELLTTEQANFEQRSILIVRMLLLKLQMGQLR